MATIAIELEAFARRLETVYLPIDVIVGEVRTLAELARTQALDVAEAIVEAAPAVDPQAEPASESVNRIALATGPELEL